MTLEEKIWKDVQKLPYPLQQELLDFVEYLLTKTEQQQEKDWASLSLTSAMRDLEDEPGLYTISDTRVSFT